MGLPPQTLLGRKAKLGLPPQTLLGTKHWGCRPKPRVGGIRPNGGEAVTVGRVFEALRASCAWAIPPKPPHYGESRGAGAVPKQGFTFLKNRDQ